MTVNTEVIGYISGAVTALCGLGLAALRGRDREKHRQAILQAKTPEQVAALEKLLPMLFRGAALLVVALGACLDASAPVVAARDASATTALGRSTPVARRCSSDADCSRGESCTRGTCSATARKPKGNALQDLAWAKGLDFEPDCRDPGLPVYKTVRQ